MPKKNNTVRNFKAEAEATNKLRALFGEEIPAPAYKTKIIKKALANGKTEIFCRIGNHTYKTTLERGESIRDRVPIQMVKIFKAFFKEEDFDPNYKSKFKNNNY